MADEVPQLTPGGIRQMLATGSSVNLNIEPLLQVLMVKAVVAKSGSDTPTRYRVILSDGEVYTQAMLSSQLNALAVSEDITRNSVVRVTDFSVNKIQERQIIILLGCDVIVKSTLERIGDPANIDKVAAGVASDNGGAAAAAAAVKSEQSAGLQHQQRPQAPQQQYGRAQPQSTTSVDLSNMAIYPIEGLSPYQNKWTIRARVTNKSEIKHWSNQRGEGKLFSCTFMDETAEIKATGFNQECDRLFPLLQEGHVYFVTKARVNIARKKFSNLANEYEITFEKDTQISEVSEKDAEGVPELKFNFVLLDKLEGIEPKQTCDVVGVVNSVGEVSEIISKANQKPVAKRELTLVDQSRQSVRLTLWGKTAETYGTPSGQPGCGPDDKPVIAFKGTSVSDFGGRSLSMFSTSTMHVNPDIPEAHGLRGWYDHEGAQMEGQWKSFASTGLSAGAQAADNLQERKTIQEALDAQLGQSEKPDYFNFKGTLIFIKKTNLYYEACAKEGCSKKVTRVSDDAWRCEKCDATFPKPNYRYIIQANVQDHTGSLWVSGFNAEGETLIDLPASELAAMQEGNDEEAYDAALQNSNGKSYIFNVRAKQDVFNDTPRVRYQITRMAPVDHQKHGKELVEAIKRLMTT